MGNGKLALVMPTYRFNATARHCIQTLASIGGGDVDVFIGDNSENPEKWAFLHKLAARSENCHIFCHERNIGGANWSVMIRHTDHEFIAPASDDDFFTPDYYLAGRDILRANPDCAAANGLHLGFTWHGPKLEVSAPNDYRQNTAIERISAYYYWGNSLCYSVYRSCLMKGLDRYFIDRPYWPSYMDQFIAYTLLCSGKYMIDPERRLFVYNNQHWGNPETAYDQDAKWFAAGGLPRGFIHLNRLCWTADIVHFFNSTYRPAGLSDAESDAIVDSLFARMFVHEFSIHLNANAADIGELFQHAPHCVQALRQIVYTPWRDVQTFLALFVTILEAFNADLARRYQAFVGASLRHSTSEAKSREEAMA